MAQYQICAARTWYQDNVRIQPIPVRHHFVYKLPDRGLHHAFEDEQAHLVSSLRNNLNKSLVGWVRTFAEKAFRLQQVGVVLVAGAYGFGDLAPARELLPDDPDGGFKHVEGGVGVGVGGCDDRHPVNLVWLVLNLLVKLPNVIPNR